jgi:NADP-dependent 3-hydroxy acid dehydrogenase YdfG
MTTNSTSTITENPVWFITGCSTGFGRALASHVLELGYRTVVTARDPDTVKDLASKGDALILKRQKISLGILMCSSTTLASAILLRWKKARKIKYAECSISMYSV